MNLLTTGQVAEKLQLNRKVVERKTRDLVDPIPAIKIGKEWRYIEEEIDEWVLKHRYESAEAVTVREMADDIINGMQLRAARRFAGKKGG